MPGKDGELVWRAVGDVHGIQVGQMLEPHDGCTTMPLERKVAHDRQHEGTRIIDFAMVRRIDGACIGFLHQIFGVAGRDQPRRLPPECLAVR